MGHLFPVDFSEEIQLGLGSPLDALRLQAIGAADARDLRELGPEILAIAADPASEIEVRITAIEALANLRPRGARVLLGKLRGETAPIGHFAGDALYNLEQNARAEAQLAEARLPPGFPPPPSAPRLAIFMSRERRLRNFPEVRPAAKAREGP